MSVEWVDTPESEPVARIGYDAAFEEIWVEFRTGAVYVYMGAPAGVFEAFRTADSKGSFVHRALKDAYPYRKE